MKSLMYIRFLDHYSHEVDLDDKSKLPIEDLALEVVGWFVSENDTYIRVAWLRNAPDNGIIDQSETQCMNILKVTIIDQLVLGEVLETGNVGQFDPTTGKWGRGCEGSEYL